MLTPHAALVHIMVVVAAADGDMPDGELQRMGQICRLWPAFKGFDTGGAAGLLFPYLFVTIACGACSGFHGLVCSGTTSKQVAKESHCHPVGYGAMLLEGFVAVIALATVMIATSAEVQGYFSARSLRMA